MTNRRRCSSGFALLILVVVLGCDSPAEVAQVPPDRTGPEVHAGAAGAGGVEQSAAAGAAGAAGSAGTQIVGLLIDDFEDGDSVPLLGGGWYDYTDENNGGGSTTTISRDDGGNIAMTGEGFESTLSLEVEYAFEQADLPYAPYIGFGVSLAGSSAPLDLSRHVGIAYSYRGGAHRLRVETHDVLDYDFYGMDLPAAAAWTTVQIPFDLLTQGGWGDAVELDLSNVGAVSFELRGSSGETGVLRVDNLTVLAALSDTGPDMTLNEPDPPADEEIDSIVISNSLQEQALQHLDRGYNITNWLEQGCFDGFDYDEDFVAALAEAGFQSLRLPIDLDLYIEESSGSGDSLELVVHDDLFLVLDSFADWTEAHGLSLTIDYHQYDHSFEVTDADSVAQAVELWSLVAEHFAGNPRDDLYYELLNEPELSAASRAPTQEEWTGIAEQMIAAIRIHDDLRTIIFGDVEWYGINALVQREPLADPNVVYAFHFYEPFIFTHQGASWTSMASTHDIPYPYLVERWSEYYSDLGFNAFMEPWILGQVQDYYRGGSRSAIRNRIVEAKRWAVANNVALICNEFGAYDRTSRPEDRVRYYTDLIEIFGELEIPWQHWFMIMDESGTVIDEYRTAFELND